jgi:hypothetical protein
MVCGAKRIRSLYLPWMTGVTPRLSTTTPPEVLTSLFTINGAITPRRDALAKQTSLTLLTFLIAAGSRSHSLGLGQRARRRRCCGHRRCCGPRWLCAILGTRKAVHCCHLRRISSVGTVDDKGFVDLEFFATSPYCL